MSSENIKRQELKGQGYLYKKNLLHTFLDAAESHGSGEHKQEVISIIESIIDNMQRELDDRCADLGISTSLSERDKLAEIGSLLMVNYMPGQAKKKRKRGRPRKDENIDILRSRKVSLMRLSLNEEAKRVLEEGEEGIDFNNKSVCTDKLMIELLRHIAAAGRVDDSDLIEQFGPMVTEETIINSVSRGNTHRQAEQSQIIEHYEQFGITK